MNAEHEVEIRKFPLTIKKGERYMFIGPNGIGKSTLLKRLMMIHEHKENIMKEYNAILKDKTKDGMIKEPDTTHPEENIAMIHNKVKVGYYSQDFDALDMNMNVRDALENIAAEETSDQDIYRVAAQFLLTKEFLKNTIGSLSE